MKMKQERNYHIQPAALDVSGHPVDVYPEVVFFLPGTNLRIWYISDETESPMHWHYCMEILYCTEGEYTVRTAENTYAVKDGKILVIPSELMHEYASSEKCKGFVHLLGADFLKSIPSVSRGLSLLTQPLMISEDDMPVLYSGVNSKLFQMREAYFSDNSLREARIDGLLLFLVEDIIRYLSHEQPDASAKLDKNGQYRQVINDALVYINAHLSEELSVDRLANRLGLSRSHFMHLFRQYTSYSFVEYLSLRRVQEAERLLTLPELTLTEIATRVGFGSAASFTRVFKEVYHALPSEYRREM